MQTPPSPPTAQSQQDDSHLGVLSICHFVMAGLSLLGGAFLLVHYLFMNALMTGAIGQSSSAPAPPPEFWMIMKAFYSVGALALVAGIVLNVLSAVFLRQRRHRMFSMVVAGINCLQVPLGTTLGVFTFVVLMRESVRETYERQAQPWSA